MKSFSPVIVAEPDELRNVVRTGLPACEFSESSPHDVWFKVSRFRKTDQFRVYLPSLRTLNGNSIVTLSVTRHGLPSGYSAVIVRGKHWYCRLSRSFPRVLNDFLSDEPDEHSSPHDKQP